MAVNDPGAPFKLVGGRLCLDFINTVSGRLPHRRPGGRDYLDRIEKERLVGFDDLVRWGRTTGAVSATEAAALERGGRASPAQAARIVARARALREAAYRTFKAVIERWPIDPRDLGALNHEVARARECERLDPTRRGVQWSWTSDEALDRVLWPVARSAAELLTGPPADLERVRQCGGADCHWLFLDTTRNRSRRWCDMAECGNLAKVRRFRRRH